MPITASGLYTTTFMDMLNNDVAVDVTVDTFRVALFTNVITPAFDTNTVYSSANEVPNGSGYTTGGAVLGSPTLTTSSGTLIYDAVDTAWTSSTFSAVRGCLIYDTTVSNRSLCLVNFVSDFAVTAGTFTIQWDATGIFRLDITP